LRAEGWKIEIDGKEATWAGPFKGQLRTDGNGIELSGGFQISKGWFDVRNLMDADLSQLCFLVDVDGGLRILPPDVAERFGWIQLGTLDEKEKLRFERSQAWLVDLLVGDRRDIVVDAGFERLREQLRSFERPAPLPTPPGFGAELRPYQREGLGWLAALHRLGLGGCLADDMGLGKTVQVLAALELGRQERAREAARDVAGGVAPAPSAPATASPRRISKGRLAREAKRLGALPAPAVAVAGSQAPREQERLPSLVIAPRSVLFNWLAEARRFAPQLVVAPHHGADRKKEFAATSKADLIVTSYATLRQDIDEFAALRFDRVILDEAQAIKNRGSQIAQSVKRLRARQRLALTGTPVENKIADLWSIFDFLNPGMLGAIGRFERLLSLDPNGSETSAASVGLAAIGKAVRPFFLRRTKSQVLTELPEKTEQTLWVELGASQRSAYQALQTESRTRLLGKQVAAREEGQHRLAILTALLRLRQCALHPGLLEGAAPEAASAKFEELLERLQTSVAEGHRALVFSQFTSLLALLRPRLDELGLAHAYLDGATSDREAVVRRFEAEDGPPVFLLSLKAGGAGLNLTRADHVFLLDPWWNPAVEAQAIGRAHRMGQKRAVSAYRLVARDTIEERILELQQHKAELANALFDESNASIGNLSREDLEWLLR
jgi:SNF2 family DNA or RNA helicase